MSEPYIEPYGPVDFYGSPPRGESYQEIKNRPPETIKTWQELIDGYATQPCREWPDCRGS